jgi:hypothetical protein
LEDIAAHPGTIPPSVGSVHVGDVLYADIVGRASLPTVHGPLRAELQMPATRLWHEMKVVAGLEAAR